MASNVQCWGSIEDAEDCGEWEGMYLPKAAAATMLLLLTALREWDPVWTDHRTG